MISKAATMSIPVRRILTIHPNGLESLILTLPALRALRESFPGARIGSVIPDSLQSLMEESPDVDDILARRHRGISSQTALWVNLREQHFDMAICFSISRHATLMAFASGAAVRAGFSSARLGRLLTLQVPKESPPYCGGGPSTAARSVCKSPGRDTGAWLEGHSCSCLEVG